MLDALIIKKLFNQSVLEFGPSVTSYLFYRKTELSLCPPHKYLDFLLYLGLIINKEHPSETGIIINNNKTVFVTSDAQLGDRSKEIHVNQPQRLCDSHDALWWVRYTYLLFGLACTTYPIFLKMNICQSDDVFIFQKFGQVSHPNMSQSVIPKPTHARFYH